MKTIRPFSRPKPFRVARACALGGTLPLLGAAACYDGPRPVFEDGEAQVVPEFADSATWVRHELWVETDFDSDGDGAPDRVHVDVTRPAATESGLEVAVIYETSPYYSGTGGLDFSYFWDIRQEVGAPPPPRTVMPPMDHIEEQPVISNSHIATWVPRGFAVVHSQSPGTGQSQGCPTVGGENESLAPKAVIDWLVSHNHADSCVICMTGSRGRPGLLSARRGERSEPERALNRDGGRIDMLAGHKGPC